MRRKKNTRDAYQQLEHIISSTLEDVAHKIMIRLSDDIVIYNRYAIEDGDTVTVRNRGGDVIAQFYWVKLAVLWTILQHDGKYYEANRITHLNRMLGGVITDMQIHDRLSRRGEESSRFISRTKLEVDRGRYRQIMHELDKYSILARMCQEKRNKSCN